MADNYNAVLADLMAARANGQSVEGGLAALEEMRRELQMLEFIEKTAPITMKTWRRITAEQLDVFDKGGDAPRPSDRNLIPEGRSDAPVAEQSTAGASATRYRVGRKVPVNIYDGDTIMGQCQSAEYAKQVVDALNREEISEQDYEDGDPTLRHTWDTPPECAARKALEPFKTAYEYALDRYEKLDYNRALELAVTRLLPADFRNSIAALATPCPCSELRAALKETNAEYCGADDERIQLRAENERLTVQLAGCSVAAEGGTKDPATRDQWGWSPAYQEVLDLRVKYDASTQEATTLRTKLHEAYRELYEALHARDLAIRACNEAMEEKRAAEAKRREA